MKNVWTKYCGSSDGPMDGWGQNERIRSDRVSKVMDAISNGFSVVVADQTGPTSARNPDNVAEFFDWIESDNGAGFYSEIRRQAGVFRGAENVYWQFGNEITSDSWRENVAAWAGQDPNGFNVIPYYVEYYLAVGAQAVKDSGCGFPVVAGSIGNASGDKKRAFLNDLMYYQIEGWFAPQYAGKRVHEIVEVISIHYTVGRDNWLEALNDIWDRWLVPGHIERLFSTEEVGKNASNTGKGAKKAVQIWARYLSFFRMVNPDRCKVLYWGTGLGPSNITQNDGLKALHDHLGDIPLTFVEYGVRKLPDDWEGRLFMGTGDRHIAVVNSCTKSVASSTLDKIVIRGQWSDDVHVLLRVWYEGSTETIVPAAVVVRDNKMTVRLPKSFIFDPDAPPTIAVEIID